MKRLHVLFLTSWYPSRILKTNGDFIQRHAEAVSLQNDVTVLHVKTDNNLTSLIEIDDLIINDVRTIIAYVKTTKNPLVKVFRFINAYKTLLKKVLPYDITHTNKFYPVGLIAYWIKKTKKVPYLISEHHHIYYPNFNHKIGFVEKLLSKIIVKNASFVCPVSNDLGNAMQFFGLKGNYQPVPNVINTSVFKPKRICKNDIFTMLHVSNMSNVKNSNGIINTLKKLENHITNYEVIFIGAKNSLTEQYRNNKHFVFIEKVSQEKLSTYYNQADVLLLFSEIETFSCVVYESISCGTPVIATNIGGIPEYFNDAFGMLVQPNNEEELLQAILKINTDYQVDSKEKMHQYVETKFGKVQIASTFTHLYRKVLKTNN